MRNLSVVVFVFISVFAIASCNRPQKTEPVGEKRTSGETTILVDETFGRILDSQIEVFKSDYAGVTVNTVSGNENEILPTFRKGDVKMMILSRMLKSAEEHFYKQRKSAIYVDRFAIDGLALIVNKRVTDSTITVEEAYEIMRGTSKTGRKLVFDNPYSSTIRYFIDSAGVKTLPKEGVYTLKTTNDVVKYVAEHTDYIGVIGVNWFASAREDGSSYMSQVKTLGVKAKPGKIGADAFYKPIQENLINGKYPFLRNVYVINAEGTNGLGTGFANWLASPRGQLIVLKSGLGPHEVAQREFNIRTNSKN